MNLFEHRAGGAPTPPKFVSGWIPIRAMIVAPQGIVLETIVLLLLFPAGFVQAAAEIDRLAQTLRENPNVETVLPLLPVFDTLLRDEETAQETLPLVEQAAEILRPTAAEKGHWPATARLLKSAARMRFEQAEPARAAKHLQSLRDLYRMLGERLPPANAGTHQARWTFEVSLEYLRGEQTNAALETLGETIDQAPLTLPEFDEFRAAVAGALHRRLEQMNTNERYELLHAWTMPGDGKRAVRALASLASVEAPPDVFARALGERPRANAFRIPDVGGVDGLFSTAWSLIRAASESGRLRRLTAELEELTRANVPGADDVLLLAQITDASTGVDVLQSRLDKRLEPGEQSTDLVNGAVFGAACLERKELHSLAQHVFERLLERFGVASAEYGRSFLRRARAIAILKRHEGAAATLPADPGLKFWIPASAENAVRSATGAVRETWLSHESHIVHLAGPQNDYLCFRYPLAGEFEFQVEAQFGGSEATLGSVAFGGIAYILGGPATADELRVTALDIRRIGSRPFPFFRKEPWPTYQRLMLRSTGKGSELVINGRPVWSDPSPDSTSPWLALRCFGNHIPAFRNLRLTGNPSIPREVRASEDIMLRGWFPQFYPSKMPSLVSSNGVTSPNVAQAPTEISAPAEAALSSTEFDWSLHDGVIHGAHRGELLRTAVPGRLTYFRPLQNDESTSYEFLYEPGRHEVHPALGRLAFLIEPNGVRVHWMTAGDAEWTGLAEDNATIEPLNRRGPRPLPLNAGRWNRVTVALKQETLTLTLNDIEIYARKMEAGNSRRFSLFYDRSRSAAQARNVVMRGDWPERLTADEMQNLVSSRESADKSVGAVRPLRATIAE